jgi:DNA-binding MarR family transcriptional regulator
MRARYTPDDISQATRRLELAVSRLTAALARNAGVSVPELLALEHLGDRAGVGPGELARLLQLTSGSVTALVDRLEASGRAVRAAHPGDRRRVVVLRTPKADEDLQREAATLTEAVQDLAAGLSDGERVVVGRFLEELTGIFQRTADEASAA